MPKPKSIVRTDAATFPNAAVQASEWRFLNEWNKEDIPAHPGRYEIRHAPGGVPSQSIAGNTPTTRRLKQEEAQRQITCHEMNSILYIGKAVNLADRFWCLLGTWKSNDGNRQDEKHHGSYNTWLEKGLQSTYPINDMQFRYFPVSNEEWKPKQKTAVDGIRAALMKQDGSAIDNLATGASFAAENSRLRLYEAFFGKGLTPPLNTLGRGKKQMTNASLDAHLDEVGQETEMSAEEQANDLTMEDSYTNSTFVNRDQS